MDEFKAAQSGEIIMDDKDERIKELEKIEEKYNELVRVLQELTGSNNLENPGLGVAASVALICKERDALARKLERAEEWMRTFTRVVYGSGTRYEKEWRERVLEEPIGR